MKKESGFTLIEQKFLTRTSKSDNDYEFSGQGVCISQANDDKGQLYVKYAFIIGFAEEVEMAFVRKTKNPGINPGDITTWTCQIPKSKEQSLVEVLLDREFGNLYYTVQGSPPYLLK